MKKIFNALFSTKKEVETVEPDAVIAVRDKFGNVTYRDYWKHSHQFVDEVANAYNQAHGIKNSRDNEIKLVGK